MLKRTLLQALVFVAMAGVGSLQAGGPPGGSGDCSVFDVVGCAQNPATPGDTCNGFMGARDCYHLAQAPSECDLQTVACTAAGCGSKQTITCKFSGTYDEEACAEDPNCDPDAGSSGED